MENLQNGFILIKICSNLNKQLYYTNSEATPSKILIDENALSQAKNYPTLTTCLFNNSLHIHINTLVNFLSSASNPKIEEFLFSLRNSEQCRMSLQTRFFSP